jgi:hypothetical protein
MAAGTGKQNSDLPADDFYVVTPSDTVDLPIITRAITLAVGGVVKCTKLNGLTETPTWPAGVIPVRVSRIWATGTTATGITALV